MGGYDWRFSRRNVWAVENMLLELAAPQDQAIAQARAAASGEEVSRRIWPKHNKKPLYYRGREKWTEIPNAYFLWMTRVAAHRHMIANSEFLRSVTSMQPG